MLGGVGQKSAAQANVAVDSQPTMAGASGPGGLLSGEKDAKTASTDAKFGEVLGQIQAKYGAKPEKPREIKKTLGKDDFLKIMITQLKHQDPTNPFKAEQMATEMAQFTSVEQLQNVNQNLGKMASQNQPLERLAMTNLIGKTVTIDRERFPHTEGSPESLSFNLPKDAAEVKISLVSDTGETVLEKDLGAQKAGAGSFDWDGKKSNTLPAKSGTYLLRVSAKDDKGRSLLTNPQGQARVIGVSFEGPEPVFLVGDAHHQDKVTMKNIIKIEDASGNLPGASSGGAMAPGAPEKPQNFFSFQKGVGSTNLNPTQSSDSDTQKALERYQASQQAEKSQAPSEPPAPAMSTAPAHPEEKGFPNGLHD